MSLSSSWSWVIDIPLERGRASVGIVEFLSEHGHKYMDDDREEHTAFVFSRAFTRGYGLVAMRDRINNACKLALLPYKIIEVTALPPREHTHEPRGLRIVVAATVGLASLCE